jgi:endonuclease YncB( thermonuclease family)
MGTCFSSNKSLTPIAATTTISNNKNGHDEIKSEPITKIILDENPNDNNDQGEQSSKNKFEHKTIINNITDDQLMIDRLENLDETFIENFPCYTLKGKILIAKIVDIHDGDTVTTTYYIDDNNNKNKNHAQFLMKRPCRLFGLDAPEIGAKASDLEKQAGKLVGQWLEKYIRENTKNQNQILWIRFTKEEKFGRDMGILYLRNPDLINNDNNNTNKLSEDDLLKKVKITQKKLDQKNMQNSINQLLIDKKFAKPYFGEAKQKWTTKELNYIINTINHN